MAVIDREEYNRIQQEISLEYEKEVGHAEGVEQGIAEGIQQGIQQGIEQKTKEDAINFYKNGVSKEIICTSLNITPEQLEKYLKEVSNS